MASGMVGSFLPSMSGLAPRNSRNAAWSPPASRYERGYGKLLMDQITQADEGCDFRFLAGTQPTPEPEIF